MLFFPHIEVHVHTKESWRFSDNRATIPEEEARANALLIAAAPDMLRLLWSIKSHLEGMPLYAGTQLFDDDNTALESITRTLDQATKGRTE